MKRRCAVILLVFSFPLFSFGQDSVSNQKMKLGGWLTVQFSLTNTFSDEARNEASASIRAFVHSNSVNLPFSFALLGNNFIDDGMKKKVSDRLKNKNVLEESYDARFFGSWTCDTFLFKSPALLSVDYSFGGFTSSKFTEGAFNTVFYGNAYYAGQTADFSGTKVYNYEYDRLGFSVQKEFHSEKSWWQASAKISLTGIHTAAHLRIDQASLFTEQNGEYLDATYNFEYNVSDSSNHGPFQIDGVGPALDLMTSWMNASRNSRLSFYVSDLGFAVWNKKTRAYNGDSSVHYEGIEVNNFFSQDNSSGIHFNKDSLLKYTGTTLKFGSKPFFFPAGFSVMFEHSFTEKMSVQSGISYRPFPDLIPLFFVKPYWKLSPSFQIAAIVSYGGTANYALGFEMKALVMNQWKIIFGSDNVLGIFIPEQTTSASLFLQLSFQF
ncbi:MAG: DUF5723 family protein [Chitinophagales bacterium]